jgi:sugar lactone lactonase YvrE
VFSDVPGDLQLRWIEDDNRVTEFRKPSGNSNGNTFDYQGRQISCQHGYRRVVMAKDSTLLTMSLLTKMITQSGLLTQVMES